MENIGNGKQEKMQIRIYGDMENIEESKSGKWKILYT